MSVATFEGVVVEHGQIQLKDAVRLPEKTKVYVIVPDVQISQTARVFSPRLAHPEQMVDFELEVIEEDLTTGRKVFRFVRGPVFAHIVLADEINRTPPKTQSALLQAMQEHEVSAGGENLRLEEPFFVLATQNPIEQEGTYPLPEAQLDRFMFNLWMDYPSAAEEHEIVRTTTGAMGQEVERILDGPRIVELQGLVRKVPVSDHVIEVAVELVRQTRPNEDGAPEYVHTWVRWGAGPRASQYLILGAKTRAILDGRYAPSVDDVRAVALPVLRHRIVTNFNAEADGVGTPEIIERLLSEKNRE